MDTATPIAKAMMKTIWVDPAEDDQCYTLALLKKTEIGRINCSNHRNWRRFVRARDRSYRAVEDQRLDGENPFLRRVLADLGAQLR